MHITFRHLSVLLVSITLSCSSKQESNELADESASEVEESNDGFSTFFACLDEFPETWKILTNTGNGLFFVEPCEGSLETLMFVDSESDHPRIIYSVGADGYAYTILACKSEQKDSQKIYSFKVHNDSDSEEEESIITFTVNGLSFENMTTAWSRGIGGPELLEFVSVQEFGKHETIVEVCNTLTGEYDFEIKRNPKNVIDVFLTMPVEERFKLAPQEMEENFLGRRDFLSQTSFEKNEIDTTNALLHLVTGDELPLSVTLAAIGDYKEQRYWGVSYNQMGGDCDITFYKIILFRDGKWRDVTTAAMPAISSADFSASKTTNPVIGKAFNLYPEFKAMGGTSSFKFESICEIEASSVFGGQDQANRYYEATSTLDYNTLELTWNPSNGKLEIARQLKN